MAPCRRHPVSPPRRGPGTRQTNDLWLLLLSTPACAGTKTGKLRKPAAPRPGNRRPVNAAFTSAG